MADILRLADMPANVIGALLVTCNNFGTVTYYAKDPWDPDSGESCFVSTIDPFKLVHLDGWRIVRKFGRVYMSNKHSCNAKNLCSIPFRKPDGNFW